MTRCTCGGNSTAPLGLLAIFIFSKFRNTRQVRIALSGLLERVQRQLHFGPHPSHAAPSQPDGLRQDALAHQLVDRGLCAIKLMREARLRRVCRWSLIRHGISWVLHGLSGTTSAEMCSRAKVSGSRYSRVSRTRSP